MVRAAAHVLLFLTYYTFTIKVFQTEIPETDEKINIIIIRTKRDSFNFCFILGKLKVIKMEMKEFKSNKI